MLELLKSKTMIGFAIFVLGFTYFGAVQSVEAEKQNDESKNIVMTSNK